MSAPLPNPSPKRKRLSNQYFKFFILQNQVFLFLTLPGDLAILWSKGLFSPTYLVFNINIIFA